MATTMNTITDAHERVRRGLLNYLDDVACSLGIGLESCTIDLDPPVSAYMALDHRLPSFPARDLALLWDEVRGWSAAVETHSGEDLIVVSYLDSDVAAPPAEQVTRFVRELRRGGSRPSTTDPPAIRTATG